MAAVAVGAVESVGSAVCCPHFPQRRGIQLLSRIMKGSLSYIPRNNQISAGNEEGHEWNQVKFDSTDHI